MLRVTFWVSWIPIVVCGLLLSLGLAWTGATAAGPAAALAAGFVPASAACTAWALLVGRLMASPRESGAVAVPFFLYSAALWLPVYAIVTCAGGRTAGSTPAISVMATLFVLLLWLLPLPFMWKGVLSRWERE